jgi:predicted FMN-binding regulatory protein PaiB
VYDSPKYRAPETAADEFVDGHPYGILMACAPGSSPSATLLPFVRLADTLELHCVREDPTCAALRAASQATFLVSDYLAWTPHDWVDPANAARATLHFRAVQFSGPVTVSFEPDDVAATLRRLLDRYEPGADYEAIEDGDRYGSRLRRLAAVRLVIRDCQRKFKLGPADPPLARQQVVAHLRRRDAPGDSRAADLIERWPPGGGDA